MNIDLEPLFEATNTLEFPESLGILKKFLYVEGPNNIDAVKSNINNTDDNGNTLLHLIINGSGFEHDDQIEYLVDIMINIYNADPNCQNNDDNTPLHFAAYECNINKVTYILKNGANVNSVNKKGITPLITLFHPDGNTEATEDELCEITKLLMRNQDLRACLKR